MDNADLEKLKVSPGRLLPKFKASVTDYSVTLSSEVKEVKLSPLTSDGGASYVIKVRINCQPACFGCIIPFQTCMQGSTFSNLLGQLASVHTCSQVLK